MTFLPTRCLLLTILLALPATGHARKPKPLPDHWVSTWAASEVAISVATIQPGAGAYVPGATDTTLRQIVHTSIPTGATPLVRIEFTNALGSDPLTLAKVHIALADPLTNTAARMTGDISLATANALTFNGAASVTIPAGAEVISDPVVLTLPTNADLVISAFIPAQTITNATGYPGAFQTNFFATGNVVSQRSLAVPPSKFQPINQYFFLKSVDVQAPATAGTIVALGDSITEGYASTVNTNQRWTNLLAGRLAAQAGAAVQPPLGKAQPATLQTFAVVDEGIGGNRILHDGRGPSALARFHRDVLAIPGAKYLILFEGINDIGVAYPPKGGHDVVTAADLIAGLSQLAERAHTHGLKVIGATVLPYLGCNYSTPAGEAVRQALNAWIRTAPVFDGVIDFDKATANPADPTTLNPAYDHGDHLHPNDAGFHAMADAVDLSLFGR